MVESLLRVGFGLIQGLFSWDRFEVYLGFVWGLFAVSLWSYGLFEKLIYVKLFVCFMMVGVKFIQGCLPASLPPCLPASLPPCLHASLPPCLPASLLAPCLLACFHACVLASQVLPWLLGCLLAGLLCWLVGLLACLLASCRSTFEDRFLKKKGESKKKGKSP